MIIFTFALWICVCGAEAGRPHIVFIVADDLGWNDVSWHNPDIISPNMEMLARQGVILDSSYVQPSCSPSRNSFMTGYYPIHTGLQHLAIRPKQPNYVPEQFAFLPQKLKELGYSTHAVGKWHLGFCNWKYTPTYRGFDSFMGLYTGQSHYYRHTNGGHYDFRFNTSVHHPPEGEYSAHTFTRRAIDIIASNDPESQPLFLYLPFQSVHSPLQVPRSYLNQYHGTRNNRRKTFSGMVSAMDEAIGNITTALERHGYMNNTVIIFTTDNGGQVLTGGNNYPLRGAKATLWEGGTRGPAFVYSRTLLNRTGYINTRMIHAVDWFPTMIHVAGGNISDDIDGVNQWHAISENEPSSRTEFVYNIDDIFENAAIRVGNYKLLEGPPGNYNSWYRPNQKARTSNMTLPSTHLFDLRDDPNETVNLAELLPDVVERLKLRLEHYRRTMTPVRYPRKRHRSHPRFYEGIWSPGWC